MFLCSCGKLRDALRICLICGASVETVMPALDHDHPAQVAKTDELNHDHAPEVAHEDTVPNLALIEAGTGTAFALDEDAWHPPRPWLSRWNRPPTYHDEGV